MICNQITTIFGIEDILGRNNLLHKGRNLIIILCNISDNNHVISLAKRVNEHVCMRGLLFYFINYHHHDHRRHVRIQRVCMARKTRRYG